MKTEPTGNMIIAQQILDETIHCNHNFECLKNEDHFCLKAKVIRTVNGKIYFINCAEYCNNYKIDFGNSTVCHCPTRKEIFNKYKI